VHEQLDALREVRDFLEQHRLRHLVIGGIANAAWGRPRATRDADFKVLLGDRTIGEFVALVGTHFRFRIAEPVAFARRTYVVPIRASNRIPVDLVLGFLPYEQQAVERAVITEYQNVTFPICTAEDLIVHKAIWERERHWADIEGVLIRQGDRLDQIYIEHWLEQFAEALERPDLVGRYRNLRKEMESTRAANGGPSPPEEAGSMRSNETDNR